MISRSFDREQVGHPKGPAQFEQARAITARSLNRPRQELEQLGRLRGGENVTVTQTPGGPQLRLNVQPTMYIQLTDIAGADGSYPWMEVIRVFEQGFIPNGNVGSNVAGAPQYSPAYESQTGDTTLKVDGTTYLAELDITSGVWLFDGKN